MRIFKINGTFQTLDPYGESSAKALEKEHTDEVGMRNHKKDYLGDFASGTLTMLAE